MATRWECGYQFKSPSYPRSDLKNEGRMWDKANMKDRRALYCVLCFMSYSSVSQAGPMHIEQQYDRACRSLLFNAEELMTNRCKQGIWPSLLEFSKPVEDQDGKRSKDESVWVRTFPTFPEGFLGPLVRSSGYFARFH